MIMGARGSKSKKDSGASLVSKTQRELTFFIDKCLGAIVVPDALRAYGLNVERKTDHFPPDTPDTDWLPVVGKKGWIILTKDNQIRHNYLEIVGLLRSGTASFILSAGNFTGQEMANAYIQAMPDITRMIAKFSPPFVATVSKFGNARLKYTFDGLIQKVGRGPRRATHS